MEFRIIVSNNVFLSFSPHDEEFASQISDDLRKVGISIFVSYQSNIEDVLERTTRQSLKNSNSIIAVLSPYFLNSRHCRSELSFAHNMGCSVFSVILRSIVESGLPEEVIGQPRFDFQRWQNEADYLSEFKKLLKAIGQRSDNGATGHIWYNITDVTMNNCEVAPLSTELPENCLIEQPDLTVFTNQLEWEETDGLLENGETSNPFPNWRQQYRQTNWWHWSIEKWDHYVRSNKLRRESGSVNNETQNHERILIEYANWLVRHPDADEEVRFRRINNLTALYDVFWQVGEEPPPELKLPI